MLLPPLHFNLTAFLCWQMFVGSFAGNLTKFPYDVHDAIKQFKSSGVTNLLVDVTNNPGGCTFLTKCR